MLIRNYQKNHLVQVPCICRFLAFSDWATWPEIKLKILARKPSPKTQPKSTGQKREFLCCIISKIQPCIWQKLLTNKLTNREKFLNHCRSLAVWLFWIWINKVNKDWGIKKFPNLKAYIYNVYWSIFEFNTFLEISIPIFLKICETITGIYYIFEKFMKSQQFFNF